MVLSRQSIFNFVLVGASSLLILMTFGLVFVFGPKMVKPQPSVNDPIVFFTGDLVSGGSVQRAQKVVTLINNLMQQHQNTEMLVVSTGDNEQEGKPTFSEYQKNFGATYQTFVDKGIFRQVRGNHDAQDLAYSQYFGLNSHLNDKGFTNYSFNLGSWHLVGLDQVWESVNQNSLNFLRSDLIANTKYKCQIVFWHVPTYSSGYLHGDDLKLKQLNEAEYEAGVEIQVNGHDHNYQRFYPIDPNGKRDDVRGITTFIDGIGGEGGRKGSKISVAQEASAIYLDSFLGKEAIGTIMFTLHKVSADYALYDANSGTILDQGTIRCK